MKNSSDIFPFLLAMVSSEEKLTDLAQEEIANVAVAAKSSAGDKILSSIATHARITPKVRTLLEKSPRALVKAAWLSRNDHPEGYVEQAVRNEKRATVLAAVAAHESSNTELLNVLARMHMPAVTSELLMRNDLSNEALIDVAKVIIPSTRKGYVQHARLRELIIANPSVHDGLAQAITARKEVVFLLNIHGFVFPSSELLRLSKIILKGALEAIPNSVDKTVSRYTYLNPVHVIVRNIMLLLSQPNWEEGSVRDRQVATIIRKVKALSVKVEMICEDCLARHYGSPEEIALATRRRTDRLARIEDAKSTSTDSSLLSYTSSSDIAVLDAILANPYLKIKHFTTVTPSNERLISALVEQGEPVIEAVALILKSRRELDERITSALADEDWFKVGASAVTLIRDSTDVSPHTVRHLLEDPRLVGGAVSQLKVTEISAIFDNEYIDSKIKSHIADIAVTSLVTKLNDDTAWKAFLTLSPQMECSLEEVIDVSVSI